jgi:hypothetical protein
MELEQRDRRSSLQLLHIHAHLSLESRSQTQHNRLLCSAPYISQTHSCPLALGLDTHSMTPQPDLMATILHASMVRNNGTEVVFSKRLKVAQSSIACSQVVPHNVR